jgi:MFS superfamily sulfate permease-like transporter
MTVPSTPDPAAAPVAARTGGAAWADLGAGLCVAGLLLPEAVAYAGLAHLPAGHALTAALVGLAIYAAFGSSRVGIVAPTSSTATLAAAAVVSVPGLAGTSDPAAYAQAVQALVLLAGGLLLALAWARQGQLSSFVSRPVLRGFAFALAITIVVKQLPDAVGLALPPGTAGDPAHVLASVLGHAPQWHPASLAVALGAGLLLALLKRWPQWPASLAVMVLAIAAARVLDLPALGVQTVGLIPQPEWRPTLPALPLAQWLRLGELACGLVVLVFAESWGSVRTLALARGETVDANRELWVLGACNVAAALLPGMAVGAGFSASSANAAAGARSRWAGVAALVALAAALAFALPALQWLPRPVLAVAVISALWHALSPGPLLAVWRMDRDRALIIAAVAAVLGLGVLDGMLAAIALSLVAALRRFSQPVVHELGELDDSRNYVVIDAHAGAAPAPGLLVLRPEEPLFFASAERVAAEVVARVAARPGTRGVVLSLEESSDLDSTAVECLLELQQRLRGSGQTLVLARVKDPVRELLGRLDPQGLGATERLFWSVADAAQALRPPLSSSPPPAPSSGR